MRLKKLILPVLGLFVLGTLSYAAIPFKITFKASCEEVEIPCNFTKQTPESEHPSLTDSAYKFKMGKYAGQVISAWTLLENALTKNDKVATEIVKYCVRSKKDVSGRTNKEGLNLLLVTSYYNGENAENITKYLLQEAKWNVNAKNSLNTYKANSRTPLAAAAEINSKDRAKFLVGFNANHRIQVYDENRDMMVIEFAEEKGPAVYAFLKTIKETAALMQDAFRENINFAMTNKDEFSRLMEKVKSNGIVSDFLRVLDGNALLHTTYNLI